ncbi:hypothetical protein [Brevundimonas sp.]|uniref:hypothetical protein n=1 Tax=Brevundimonas sp. TaxID=1871086 RepID=UPI003F7179E2
MSYTLLYEQVQAQGGRISTNWLKELAVKFSDFTHINEQWSGAVDQMGLRGFFLEGPFAGPPQISEHQALIVLSRQMVKGPEGANWRRLVFTKELMHVFDTAEEKADTGEKLERQADRFGNPGANISPQYRAEQKAVWRALGALCPESDRSAYKRAVDAKTMSIAVLATTVGVPERFATELMRDDFMDQLTSSME